MTRKLCLYGLAGSGKSTVSQLMASELRSRGHTVEIVKLAEPLYRLQQHIYALTGQHVDLWEHDNDLLRTLFIQIRRISPDFIVTDFLRRASASTADIVINDDLRDSEVDYPRMRDVGFRFAYVICGEQTRAQRIGARGDTTVVPDSVATWGYDRIRPDWTVDNSLDDHAVLRQSVEDIIGGWPAI